MRNLRTTWTRGFRGIVAAIAAILTPVPAIFAPVAAILAPIPPVFLTVATTSSLRFHGYRLYTHERGEKHCYDCRLGAVHLDHPSDRQG